MEHVLSLDLSTKRSGWAYYEAADCMIQYGVIASSAADVEKRIGVMRDGVIDEAIAAAYHIALMDKDQKFYDSLLFQIWDEMKDDLNAKPTQAKMINFSRLSTFLMRQHRDQFVKILGERLDLTPEDLEEGENAAHPNEETPE